MIAPVITLFISLAGGQPGKRSGHQSLASGGQWHGPSLAALHRRSHRPAARAGERGNGPAEGKEGALSMGAALPRCPSYPHLLLPRVLFLLLSPHRLRAWWSALLASLRHPAPLLPRLPVPLSWHPCWSYCAQAQGPLSNLPQPLSHATALLRNLGGSQRPLSLGPLRAWKEPRPLVRPGRSPCSALRSGARASPSLGLLRKEVERQDLPGGSPRIQSEQASGVVRGSSGTYVSA